MTWIKNLYFEIKSMVGHGNTRMTVFIAAIGYALLYPLPYQNQLPQNIDFGVVDLDASSASRELIRMIDATPQVDVTLCMTSEIKAKRMLEQQKIRGYLVIPSDFHRNLKRHRGTTISLAGDGAYYLLYATQAEGVMTAVSSFNETYTNNIQLKSSPELINQLSTPYELVMANAYNPELGYRNYVLPSVFLLILHQLALMAMATMTWVQRQRGEHISRYNSNWWYESSCRLGAFLSIFMCLAMLYFYALLPAYNVPIVSFSWQLVSYLIAFFLAVLMLGQLLGRLISHPQIAVVVVLMSSLPLIFTAGFIWPVESMPTLWRELMSFLPATTGINGLLKLHIYGTDIMTVTSPLYYFLGIFIVSAVLDSWWVHKQQNQKIEVIDKA